MKRLNNSGQSLFEVLVATAIAALLLLAIVSLATFGVRSTAFSRNNAQASKLALEAHEWIREYRDDKDWDEFKNKSNNSYCINTFPTTSWTTAPCGDKVAVIFTRTIELQDDLVNPNIVNVTITVSWTEAGRSHEVKSTTRLTNWLK